MRDVRKPERGRLQTHFGLVPPIPVQLVEETIARFAFRA